MHFKIMIEKEINQLEDIKEDNDSESEPLTDHDWSVYNDHDDGC